MLGNLITGFITVLVGATLIGPIGNAVYGAQNYNNGSNATNGVWATNPNVSSTVSVVTGLITLFFALGVMAAGVGIAVSGLRNAGVL